MCSYIRMSDRLIIARHKIESVYFLPTNFSLARFGGEYVLFWVEKGSEKTNYFKSVNSLGEVRAVIDDIYKQLGAVDAFEANTDKKLKAFEDLEQDFKILKDTAKSFAKAHGYDFEIKSNDSFDMSINLTVKRRRAPKLAGDTVDFSLIDEMPNND